MKKNVAKIKTIIDRFVDFMKHHDMINGLFHILIAILFAWITIKIGSNMVEIVDVDGSKGAMLLVLSIVTGLFTFCYFIYGAYCFFEGLGDLYKS